MEKNNCCSDSGWCRWFCPNLVGFVAGLIMIAAGSVKLIAGKATLTFVGGMALGLVGVENANLALVFGTVAALIEVIGGLSFAVGCRKTSRWAAVFLSLVMGIAILFKLTHLKPLEGNLYLKAASLLEQIRLDLLLFAVFFHRAWKFMRSWCGGDDCCNAGGCCTTETKK